MNYPLVFPNPFKNYRSHRMVPGGHASSPLRKRKDGSIGLALWLVLIPLAIATTARALVIVPVWDSTITSDPNAAAITNTVNMAIEFYESRFANPIRVTIEFAEKSSGLSESEWYYYNIYYAQFLTNFQQHATTSNNIYALSQLPYGLSNAVPPSLTNPVNGDTIIRVKSNNLRAVGLTNYISGLPGGFDGIVRLNTSIMNLSRASMDPSKFDLLSCTEHEIDEVLALGSGLQDGYGPLLQDVFRYTSAGARSFTTNGDDAWFSLDGTNLLVQFNQNPGGDYGDWWSTGAHTPRVQDAFGTPGATPNLGVELIALNVQGYDLLPPPAPGIVNLALDGTDLLVTGTNGLATGIYDLLASTNLALPLDQWPAVATCFMTNNGDFAFTATNAVNPQSTQQFYTLQLQ
jgi:hypothetical protein